MAEHRRPAIFTLLLLGLTLAGCNCSRSPKDDPRAAGSDAQTGGERTGRLQDGRCVAGDEARANIARTAYRRCLSARDEATCKNLGGEWNDRHMQSRWACDCAAPDDGCPCKTARDCVGSCITPETRAGRCAPASEGKCRSSEVGCYCFVDDTGKVEHICGD
jgi:hypothetical protein